MNRYIILLCLILLGISGYAEKKESMTFPIIGYSDSFGLMYGVFHMRYLPDSDASQRVGLILSSGGYKVNMGVKGLSLFEKWALDGALSFEDWEHDYYGLGNDTSLDNKLELSTKEIDADLKLRRFISEHQSLGVLVSVKTREEQVERNDDTRYFKDQALLGFGVGYFLDTRDARINSEKGYLLNPQVSRIGRYTKYDLDMRYFHPLARGVLAWRVLAGRVVGGEVPFLLKYRLGTSSVLRGATGERYNGNALLSFQTEYRRHIWRMIYGAVFLESGQVGGVVAADDMHLSYGLGIHVKFGKGRQTMRLDYGVTHNRDKNMTIGFNSAF